MVILLLLVMVSWQLSSESDFQSNDASMRIAEKIVNHLDKYFDINRGDTFWKVTFNELLRKAAHFVEYALIGAVICLLLNVVLRRTWLAAVLSILVSPVFGIVDEYHQMFAPMRTPRFFDICIDTIGALTGVLFVTIFAIVFTYIRKLKHRIKELEKPEEEQIIE